MKKPTSQKFNKIQNKGFALISTIIVMSLLFLVAVSMLSLSSVQTRSANTGKAKQEAEANARMALMLAIGRLQETTGTDLCVTMPAGSLSSEGFLEQNTDPSKQNYVAVFNTLNPTGIWT